MKKHLLKVNHYNNKNFKCIFPLIQPFYFWLSITDIAKEHKMINATSFIMAENWT